MNYRHTKNLAAIIAPATVYADVANDVIVAAKKVTKKVKKVAGRHAS